VSHKPDGEVAETERILDKKARLVLGKLEIKPETFSVHRNPSDPKVRRKTFDSETQLNGERVFTV